MTKGYIMIDSNKIYDTNNCGKLRITNYVSARKVEVCFIDTGYTLITSAGEIERGGVKDKLLPTIYGVGFIGIGEHKSRLNGKQSKMYNVWLAMIQRCYSHDFQNNNKTYIGCSVCLEWHDYQNFAEWFVANYIEGYHLDKDIKVEGNKIYSPSYCLFVSQKENTVKALAKSYRFISPSGELVNIYNMREFCRSKSVGLSPSKMAAVHRGELTQHKKWLKAC